MADQIGMADDFHQAGMLAQLWWLPLGVEDGQGKYESHKYGVAKIAQEHPEWLIRSEWRTIFTRQECWRNYGGFRLESRMARENMNRTSTELRKLRRSIRNG